MSRKGRTPPGKEGWRAYELIARCIIPAVRLGRSIRVPRAALEKLLAVEQDGKTGRA